MEEWLDMELFQNVDPKDLEAVSKALLEDGYVEPAKSHASLIGEPVALTEQGAVALNMMLLMCPLNDQNITHAGGNRFPEFQNVDDKDLDVVTRALLEDGYVVPAKNAPKVKGVTQEELQKAVQINPYPLALTKKGFVALNLIVLSLDPMANLTKEPLLTMFALVRGDFETALKYTKKEISEEENNDLIDWLRREFRNGNE